jgi:hypothetical protein
VLQGVKSVIALVRLGAMLPAAQRARVEHVVLLSTAGAFAAVTASAPTTSHSFLMCAHQAAHQSHRFI